MEVAKKGSYVYWFTYKNADGAEQMTLPQRFKGTKTEVDTEALGEEFSGAKLHVMDKGTGNTAIVDFPPARDEGEAGPIQLKADDFQYVRAVKLRIVSEDKKPVESAIVNITDGMNTPMTAVVTPADEGIAVFNDVASGEINVKVEAKGLKRTIDSDIKLPEKRKTPGFERDVKVAGDVDTLPVAAAAAAPAADGGKTAPSAQQGSDGFLLQTFAGLIFLAVVIAVIYVVVKARGLTAQSALKKMGVEFPAGEAGPVASSSLGQSPAPGVEPNVCEFCGERKDGSGNCACTVAPGAAPGGTVAAAAPRLVGTQGVYSGHIFEIASESAVVGRDATNDVALPNDNTASRRHATITVSNGQYMIRDEGSSNGTFVNGARITAQALSSGDEIQIGGTKFRFEV